MSGRNWVGKLAVAGLTMMEIKGKIKNVNGQSPVFLDKMDLIVVESPTKAKTISRFLKGKFAVVASMGHVRDLPKSSLGVEVEADFKPTYESVGKNEKGIRVLKKAVAGAGEIFLATDPDREGEAIAWHVKAICEKEAKGKKFRRIVFHEITKGALAEALAKPGVLDMHLVNAQQARRILDRLVGYKLSPVLWRKVRTGLSAGRVQSVALRLVVEREKEIEAFKPVEYWEFWADFNKETEEVFAAQLMRLGGKKLMVGKGTEAKKVIDLLGKLKFAVEKVSSREVLQRPGPPLITSTLQRAAYQKFGYSGKRTMVLAQRLYEKGLITYHRTDSFNLAEAAVVKIRKYIEKEFGAEFLPDKVARFKNRSKSAQEAHEAIRPTSFGKTPLSQKEKLEAADWRLYRLIFQRAVSCQMKPARFERTTVWVKGGEGLAEAEFLAKGERLDFLGFLAVFGKWDKELPSLPKLSQGEKLVLKKLQPLQKFTQPPPRFNDASLVKALEEKEIGRPSTYAPIISTILQRQYMERVEKRFKPTALGITVVDFLQANFGKVMDYDFTAGMENGLDEVARGAFDWRKLLGDFYKPFEKTIKTVTKEAKRVEIPTEPTGRKCPKCKKGELVVRVGRFGKFLSCSRFPDCKHTAPLVEKIKGVKCPDCGKAIVVRKTKRGRIFYGCAGYPKCKWASWQDPRKKEPGEK